MRKLFGILLYLLTPLSIYTWGIDYQNLYGCVPPTLSQSMMGGRTTIKDDEITFAFKDSSKNIVNNFLDINNEITIEILSKNGQGIMMDVNHGTLSHNNIIDTSSTSFDCANARLFTRKSSITWTYKWFPSKKSDLVITFMFAPSYSPVFLTYKTLPFGSDTPTYPVTTISPIDPTVPFTTSLTDKYKYVQYKSIIFGWYLEDDKIYVVSQTKVSDCLKWFSIAFTKEDGMMIGADAIFGWGDELCNLNIDAYYLPPESKDIGKTIYNYKKSENYLLEKSVSIVNNIIIIKFVRLLNTNNPDDIIINPNNKTNIIYAIGDEMNEAIVSMHFEDESFYVDLLSGSVDNFKGKTEDYVIFFTNFVIVMLSTIFSILINYVKQLYKIRKFFNHNVKIGKLGFYSNGNIIFISLYLVWWLLLFIFSFCSSEKNQIVKRLGLWVSLNLSFSLLPISRNNISIILFKLSPDKIINIHKSIAVLFTISVIIKFIVSFIFYSTNINFSLKYSETNPLAGFLASLCVFLITIFSIFPIRNKFYEVFYYSHRLLSVLIIIFSSIHSLTTLYYILPSVMLYSIDIILRIIKINKPIHCQLANIYTDPKNCYTFVNIITQKRIKTYPACYFLMCYNKISHLEWHALSLISNDNNNLTFCIKNFGKNTWSGKIYDMIEKSNDNITLNKDILIQGPYGYLSIDYLNYKYITLVAGGIGITPMFSILEDIYNNHQNKLNKIKLIWIISNMKIFKHMKRFLVKYNYNSKFNVSIFVTNDIIHEIDLDYSIINNKPNITNELLLNMEDDLNYNAVICCGPKSLLDEVEEFCSINNIDIFSDHFMK
jgi:NAD(P)H-flavin reductase